MTLASPFWTRFEGNSMMMSHYVLQWLAENSYFSMLMLNRMNPSSNAFLQQMQWICWWVSTMNKRTRRAQVYIFFNEWISLTLFCAYASNIHRMRLCVWWCACRCAASLCVCVCVCGTHPICHHENISIPCGFDTNHWAMNTHARLTSGEQLYVTIWVNGWECWLC